MALPLKKLVQRRGIIKSKLARFRTFVDGYEEGDKEILRERVIGCHDLLGDFEKVQVEIEEFDEKRESAEDNEREREIFETHYYETLSLANRHLREVMASTPVQNVTTGTVIKPSIKLPPLKLPEFDEKHEDFPSFKDSFNALVHENANLTDGQRLHYLKGQLRGEPAEVIHSLKITKENYPIAWELLQKRYENRRLTVNNLIQTVFEIPAIAKENAKALRHLNDTLTKCSRALKSLRLPVDAWANLLIFIVSNKLNSVTRRAWEAEKYGDELPTIEEFYTFLSNRCDLLETLLPTVDNKSAKEKPRRAMSHTATVGHKCAFCNQDHYLCDCLRFKAQNMGSRLECVKRLGICFNCLKFGHRAFRCRAQRCRLCKKLHHELLHRENAPAPNVSTNAAEESFVGPSVSATQANSLLVTGVQTFLSTAVVFAEDK